MKAALAVLAIAWTSIVDRPLIAAEAPPPNPMLQTRGTAIVDAAGEPVQLRGVILEGWLMWNGTLWGAGLSSETRITERLVSLVGESETQRFRAAVYDNFITERDIQKIAELGLNAVRVPLNHSVLEEKGTEIDYSTPGWRYLDRLLDWCEQHGLYVIIGLHALPGGQSGVFVSDPDRRHVWASPEDLGRTVEIWRAIASRYRDRQVVAGYDLVNEPEPPKASDLVELHRRIIEAIRKVDPHHIVFIEGGAPASSDFSFYEEPLDDNQVYSFHSYNLFTNAVDEGHLENLARMAEAHDVPLWNGEFGAHTSDWIRRHIELFEDPAHHVNGWIFWPWKRVPEGSWAAQRYRTLMKIVPSEEWDTVRKYIASIWGNKKIAPEVASRALDSFIKAIQADNLVADDEMVGVLRSWETSEAASAPE